MSIIPENVKSILARLTECARGFLRNNEMWEAVAGDLLVHYPTMQVFSENRYLFRQAIANAFSEAERTLLFCDIPSYPRGKTPEKAKLRRRQQTVSNCFYLFIVLS